MLNKEARNNLKTIQQLAKELWGPDCELEKPDIIDSPYPEFELRMRLFGRVEVGVYYDRSTYDIGIKQGEEYVLLQKFTDRPVMRGMEEMEPENLRRNFDVLDEVAREMCR